MSLSFYFAESQEPLDTYLWWRLQVFYLVFTFSFFISNVSMNCGDKEEKHCALLKKQKQNQTPTISSLSYR